MRKVFKPPLWVGVLLFIFIGQKVKGQEENKITSFSEKHEWEIATNMLPVFTSSKSPYSTLIRKNFIRLRDKKLIKRAYRLSIDLDSRIQKANLNYPNTSSSALINDFGNTTYFMLRLGYEWQFHFQKFHFYYGYEITGSYRSLLFDISNSNTKLQGVIYSEDRQYGYGLRLLTGVKYFIHPRFAISAETGLSLERISQSVLWKQRTSPIDVVEEFSYQRNINSIQYSPLLALNLSILF
jgi:hypothetical protein